MLQNTMPVIYSRGVGANTLSIPFFSFMFCLFTSFSCIHLGEAKAVGRCMN
jgi:hypothetical protein